MPHKSPDDFSPLVLAEALADILAQERDTLVRLRASLERQLAALGHRNHDGLEEATLQSSREVHTLHQLRTDRNRRLQALGAVLGQDAAPPSLAGLVTRLREQVPDEAVSDRLSEMREHLTALARTTRRRCDDLHFALEYALRVGNELLHAWWGPSVSPGSRLYTAAGKTRTVLSPPALLNQIG